MDVAVVGAGIAGLVCAIELARVGKTVVVFEAEPEAGGRVRSTMVNGCTIDHGFQVLFTAYPVLTSYLDLPALGLRKFRPAGHIVTERGESLVGDAIADLSLLMDVLVADAVPLFDKARLLSLRHFAQSLTIDACFGAEFRSVSTRQFLMSRGFSDETIDNFFAPFYGGILLDRSLSAHAGVLLFTFKMLAEGDTVVPARGMGAIAEQLKSKLAVGTVRVSERVTAVRVEGNRAVGVTLANGTHVDASHVVLATSSPVAAVLAATAGVTSAASTKSVGSTTLYFTSATSPLPGNSLWLNARKDAVISHAITITDVAPEYAKTGALFAATVVGSTADHSDAELIEATQREVSEMARVANTGAVPPMTLVSIQRVPYSQFAQPPGSVPLSTEIDSNVRGLWRASEAMHSSSLEGAARGGRMAARAILGASS